MKLNFKDILNAVNKIEQSRGHYGKNYDYLNLCEKYESTRCAVDTALALDSVIRIYSVEREDDGTFTVNIPENHFKVNK
jgi:hypothetical protein